VLIIICSRTSRRGLRYIPIRILGDPKQTPIRETDVLLGCLWFGIKTCFQLRVFSFSLGYCSICRPQVQRASCFAVSPDCFRRRFKNTSCCAGNGIPTLSCIYIISTELCGLPLQVCAHPFTAFSTHSPVCLHLHSKYCSPSYVYFIFRNLPSSRQPAPDPQIFYCSSLLSDSTSNAWDVFFAIYLLN
jgi:hypothetical protein